MFKFDTCMSMMASISRVGTSVGFGCGLSVCLSLHIGSAHQANNCHDKEKGPHGDEELGGREVGGRLPTSREALKLTGELEDGWHLYKAVTGSVAANQHVPRSSGAAGTPCFYNLSFQLEYFHPKVKLVSLRSRRGVFPLALCCSRILPPPDSHSLPP